MSLFSFLASSWSLRNIKGGRITVPPKLTILATIITGTTFYKINKVIRSESVRRATYFWWNIGPVVVHYKFTKFWFTKINTTADLTKRNQVYNELHTKYAPKCYNSALHLKGLYIKLMQICSSRPDFIPIQYIKLFILAQDSLPQYPIEQIKDIINNSLLTSNEQGLSYDDIFINIDEIALGSASIGQCHKATIRRKYITADNDDASDSNSNSIDDDVEDTATIDVAVKVMHPDAEQRFQYDFQVFRWLCKIALTGWTPILDEAYRQIMSEFDYRKEASSLDIVRTNTCFKTKTNNNEAGSSSKDSSSPFINKVYIPKPYKSLCTKEVLVMELLHGIKLTDYIENELSNILGSKKSKQLLERKQLELILGQDKLQYLDGNEKQQHDSTNTNPSTTTTTTTIDDILNDCGWKTKLQLLKLYKKTQKTIDLLVDVQGYQMLRNNVFQGDPHPGNIMQLNQKKKFFGRGGGPSLGLIDYGQTKTITNKERYGIAKVILALEDDDDDDDDDADADADAVDKSNNSLKVEKIAIAMRQLGFITKNNNSLILSKYARLFFDSDEERMLYPNCPTPQSYFKLLTELDPLIVVPDVAVFVARCGFILRGMGTLLGKQIKTSKRWSVYAKQAIQEEEVEKEKGTNIANGYD